MSSASAMNQSLKYNRSLRVKTYYFKDKRFRPNWGKNVKKVHKNPGKGRQTIMRAKNEAYVEEMKSSHRRAIIISLAISSVVFYGLFKLLF